jgi:hypothetical protein
MRPSLKLALAACLALSAPALPGAAHAQTRSDVTPPSVDVWGANAGVRCDGSGRVRIEIRVRDASSTKTVVRVDGRVVKRSTRKRFAAYARLDAAAHVVRALARDSAGNRFVFRLRLTACT